VVGQDIGDSIKKMKEGLRQIPNKGIGYGAIHGYVDDILPRISFNYLGQFDKEGGQDVWSITGEGSGIQVDSSNEDRNIININGLVIDGMLQFNIASKLGKDRTVELAANFKRALESIIEYTEQASRSYITASDIDIDQQVLWTHHKNCYQTIVKLNNSYRKPNMFMIHPGGGGCEVYSAIANRLANDFSCYGVDSYNLYNKKKIENIDELAQYYLSYIDKVMLDTHQEYYHLFGWSLGGQIALEIASILEQKCVKKIKLYILDTVLLDDCLSFLMQDMHLEFKNNYKNHTSLNRYEKSYIEKLIINIDLEATLSKQKISSTLTNSQILLFKVNFCMYLCSLLIYYYENFRLSVWMYFCVSFVFSKCI
jgi:non-ribosomal peptide synthase protein (TIGR01720 family)